MTFPFALVLALGLAPGDAPLRVDVTADTWVSGVGPEVDGNNGGSPRLKLKSHQEMTLLDVDADALRPRLAGRAIRSATLHVRSVGEPRLGRVTVGGTAAFREGTGTNYERQPGASTFRSLAFPDVPWAPADPLLPARTGDIATVLFGPEGASWGSADASEPDPQGWQAVAVDPRVIAARVHGLVGGFVVYDDTGTEWTSDGERYERRMFPNRFLYSRDQNAASAPYFTVAPGPEDREPPPPPIDFREEDGTDGLPRGEAVLSWTTPEDRGGSGPLGFRLEGPVASALAARVPLAGRPGTRHRLHLRAGDLTAGRGRVALRTIDAAGNASEPSAIDVAPSSRPIRPLPPAATARPIATPPGPLPRLGAAEVAVVDELDKVRPTDGAMIPARDPSYLARNHLWDASTRSVTLTGARGEAVAFQVIVRGRADALTIRLDMDEPGVGAVDLGRMVAVMTKDGPLPDPVVPIAGPLRLPEPGQSASSLLVEVQIAKGASAGPHRGTLRLASGGDRLEIPVALNVWGFALPDRLSFLPEMNCYGLPDDERDYYRLAHRHRTYLNRVPYSQRGDVAPGCAPDWDGKALDWKAWDARFGPLLDGSAFADLPRGAVPVEGFYLPLHENWPTPIEGNYDGGYWADRAMSDAHRRAFVEASRQIAAHVRETRWDSTMFQCFFNGKNDFKDRGWSRGSSPWLLDEPANFQDFWALRVFGEWFREGVNAAPPGPGMLLYRCDISRPQWQRDVLDDVLDLNIVGGAFREYRPMVLERKERLGQVVIEYGSANAIEGSNVQPAAWCLDAWTLGSDGVLPWQTVGTAESWTKADELSLFYPGRDGGPPVPSIRLKAFRRGQQDVEYLELYRRATGEPRETLGAEVRKALGVSGVRQGTGAAGEDAGRIDFGRLAPADLAALRERIGAALANAPPPPPAPPRSFPERHPRPVGERRVGP